MSDRSDRWLRGGIFFGFGVWLASMVVRAKFNRLRRAILAFGVALNDELNRLEEL